MTVLYEDNHLLALNKPAGLLTQPSGTHTPNLEQQAKEWIQKEKKKTGNVYLHAVHRLDRGTSGVVLFAKTSKALTRLNSAIRNKETKKLYLALTENAPPHTEGTLSHFLLHDSHRARLAKPNESGAKKALLHYRTLKQKEAGCLLEITLITGRYHQIRCQLAAIGCPIVGDEKYGAKKKLQPHCFALHHLQLEIAHPTTKEILQLKAPLPGWC